MRDGGRGVKVNVRENEGGTAASAMTGAAGSFPLAAEVQGDRDGSGRGG